MEEFKLFLGGSAVRSSPSLFVQSQGFCCVGDRRRRHTTVASRLSVQDCHGLLLVVESWPVMALVHTTAGEDIDCFP